MRKITCGIAVGLLCAASIAGLCEGVTEPREAPRLIPVSQERVAVWGHVCIFYDKETRVMYMMARNGAMVAMTDAEGKPLLHEGE